MSIVVKAIHFATEAHESIGQVRKYSGIPYITHPLAVGNLVSEHGGTETQVAAAILHDTVEDTPVTQDIILTEFGEAVAELVYWMTEISKKSDGNRATRKKIDRDHMAKAPAEAQFIRIADIYHNCSGILEEDIRFAKTYIPEKILMLEAMTKVHSTDFYKKVYDFLKKEEEHLISK